MLLVEPVKKRTKTDKLSSRRQQMPVSPQSFAIFKVKICFSKS